MAKKRSTKKKSVTAAGCGAPKERATRGIGRKLAIYVPQADMHVIAGLESEQERHDAEGYRTSLSFELIRVAKIGLLALRNPKILAMIERELKQQAASGSAHV